MNDSLTALKLVFDELGIDVTDSSAESLSRMQWIVYLLQEAEGVDLGYHFKWIAFPWESR